MPWASVRIIVTVMSIWVVVVQNTRWVLPLTMWVGDCFSFGDAKDTANLIGWGRDTCNEVQYRDACLPAIIILIIILHAVVGTTNLDSYVKIRLSSQASEISQPLARECVDQIIMRKRALSISCQDCPMEGTPHVRTFVHRICTYLGSLHVLACLNCLTADCCVSKTLSRYW